ncbi:hypothetical protein niasHT_008371 [Heterodera trifolii]|uniref:LIM zinc-binding domain-containing protein n=1 Tax=Heterodera trifolii TaxID=157864 RepID=A0ABD2M687_9BILA
MPTNAIQRRMDDSQAPKCRNCQGQFKCTDVAVITDHERTNGEAIWHPNCFSCSVCQQLLADLLYFYRDGKYFCGRHYAERLYPRCFGCDELIFAREYTFAEEKSWHLEHFCCLGCDRHLSGHQ